MILLLACADPCPELDYSADDAVLRVFVSELPEDLPPALLESVEATFHWDEVDQETLRMTLGTPVCRVVPADTPVWVRADGENVDQLRRCYGDEWEQVPPGEVVDLVVELPCYEIGYP